jgi:phosphoserine aminotransferase
MTAYNLSAGPTVRPAPVLMKAQSELLSYENSGQSALEMSHRSPILESIQDAAEQPLRRLMSIPHTYSVLFLQGGATLQFAMLPQNLATKTGRIDFIDNGGWSTKAITDAKQYATVNVLASSPDHSYRFIPEGPFPSSADYLHITWYNTLEGTTYHTPPHVDAPLFADVSSSILSESLPVEAFDVVYAGAQKNLGVAGLAIVIEKNELLDRVQDKIGTYLRYDIHAKQRSLYKTPPTFSLYMTKLVLDWIEKTGLETIETRNVSQARMLHEPIYQSSYSHNHVIIKDRSRMNIPFSTGSETEDAAFLNFAARHDLINLARHRSIGRMRASFYNAMPTEGVTALIRIMHRFEQGER